MAAVSLSPDGKLAIGFGVDGKRAVFPVDGGEARAIPGLEDQDRVAGFTGDSQSIYVRNAAGLPTVVYKLDLASGKRTLWRQITPPDSAGVGSVDSFIYTPDGKSYVYSYNRTLSDLYLVEGLK